MACREGQLQRVHHVLNECLVDRGASPNLVQLEAYIDGHHITTVQVRQAACGPLGLGEGGGGRGGGQAPKDGGEASNIRGGAGVMRPCLSVTVTLSVCMLLRTGSFMPLPCSCGIFIAMRAGKVQARRCRMRKTHRCMYAYKGQTDSNEWKNIGTRKWHMCDAHVICVLTLQDHAALVCQNKVMQDLSRHPLG